MSCPSLAHRKLLPLKMVTSPTGLTPSTSKRSRALENLAAGSINFTKEEFDEIIQLIEGLGVHGLRYNKAEERALWG